MDTQNKKLQIGPYQIIPIPTGIFGLDGGSMFGTVPKVLWEKHIPADAQNRIPMEARALLLKSSDKNILIDCGNGGHFVEKFGDKLGPKFAQMYNIDPQGPSLLKSLSKAGLQPEDITDVILTHLHFDHCGGGTVWMDGKIVPQFPKAKYYVQKSNFTTAQNPNIRERASYLSSNFIPLMECGALKLVEGPQKEFLPGVSLEISNGHTQGQQLVKISDGKTTLVYCGDLIPTSAHVRLAWIMGYDLDPLLIIKEKTALLNSAEEEGWHLFFEHDSNCDACTVVKNGNDFAVDHTFRF